LGQGNRKKPFRETLKGCNNYLRYVDEAAKKQRRAFTGWYLFGADVGSLGAFGALAGNELNLLAFLKGLEALDFDAREVNEKIFATVIRLDETKTFFLVKPLYGTCAQNTFSFTFGPNGPY
jgi:hypothetical protein